MWLAWENVTLGYGRSGDVLSGVSLRLGRGLWGVAGPNGSGKSSLLRSAAGVLRPRQGRLLCDGEDAWQNSVAYRWRVGYAPQEVLEFPDMRAGAYLAYLAALKGVRAERQKARAQEMLRLTGLDDRNPRVYSAGMRRRLLLAAALLNDPDILLLDEPATGLDPNDKADLWPLLGSLAADRVVLVATNVPEEIDGLADGWVAIRNKGVAFHEHLH